MAQILEHGKRFDHWKLEVYALAQRFFADAYALAREFPREDAFFRFQFLRAALSIPLNIAEGCGEYSKQEKVRFYRIARRSAGECAAILDAAQETLGIRPERLAPLYKTLARISAMLLALIRKVEKPAPRSGRANLPRTTRKPTPKPKLPP